MSITFPPELLPSPDDGEGADVFLVDPQTREIKLIASIPPAPSDKPLRIRPDKAAVQLR